MRWTLISKTSRAHQSHFDLEGFRSWRLMRQHSVFQLRFHCFDPWMVPPWPNTWAKPNLGALCIVICLCENFLLISIYFLGFVGSVIVLCLCRWAGRDETNLDFKILSALQRHSILKLFFLFAGFCILWPLDVTTMAKNLSQTQFKQFGNLCISFLHVVKSVPCWIFRFFRFCGIGDSSVLQ